MKRDILLSTDIYYIYLMFEGIKTEEVRKNVPKSKEWTKKVILYATKSSENLNRIPAGKREIYRSLLGKVVGEFYCDSWRNGKADTIRQAWAHNNPEETGLTDEELVDYATTGKLIYFLHISALKIYDKSKELNEFYRPCNGMDWDECGGCDYLQSETHPGRYVEFCGVHGKRPLDRPSQSWCYVEEI